LYDGALVAERHAAVGAFVDAHPDAVDPTVGAIIRAAGGFSVTEYLADTARVEALRVEAMALLGDADALLLPTTTAQPTIAEVAADPVGVNSRLGIYTNFCNLFDLCAVAVPAGEADGGQFGVSVLARPFADRVAVDVAALLTGTSPAPPSGPALGPAATELLVVGAHRRGQPLNGELTALAARFAATVHTAPEYRLYALDTEPPKPGLVHVGVGVGIGIGGDTIEGELWLLPPAALGTFLSSLPAPMTLGRVALEDGREVVGFGCEPMAVAGARDITQFGSWVAYLAGGRDGAGRCSGSLRAHSSCTR
jgi:allophanate hydrolase